MYVSELSDFRSRFLSWPSKDLETMHKPEYLGTANDCFLFVAPSSSTSVLRGSCQLTTPASTCLMTKGWTRPVMVSLEPHTHTNTSTQPKSSSVSNCHCTSEEESEEDEGDIITREVLKRQSQLIVDSKSKKKPWKKKGKFWSNRIPTQKDWLECEMRSLLSIKAKVSY